MIGIVYATHREAKPFLAGVHAKSLKTETIPSFVCGEPGFTPSITAISGMGKVAAAIAAMHLVHVHGVYTLISAGLCGALHRETGGATGELFRIHSAVEGDCDRFGKDEKPVVCDTQWFHGLKAARLVTCDRPVFNTGNRLQFSTMGDLVDMEGAAVARVAAVNGIGCAMVKGVSDGADETGRKALKKNIDWVSGRIAQALVNELLKK